MICPNCGAADPGSGKFCIHCGQPLPQQTAPGPAPVYQPVYPSPASVSSQSVYPQASSSASQPPGFQPLQGAASVSSMGAATVASASIWGPFAGYGTRGRHVAWLLDDLGGRAEELRQAVTERFQQRAIPGAQVLPRILTAKGMLVEQRPYYLVQRSRATAGLYLARFGQDLYVSQVSYLKSPVSTARVAVAIIAVLFVLTYPVIFASGIDSVSASMLGGVSGLGSLAGNVCCLGPLYLASLLLLALGAVMGLYKFVSEKDLLAPLRVTPNEFDQDDLIALEKAVEQTVREAMDVIGIDSKLMPPAARYGLRERII